MVSFLHLLVVITTTTRHTNLNPDHRNSGVLGVKEKVERMLNDGLQLVVPTC